jgi:TldD protein
MPPRDALGTLRLGTPEVTITGDRSRPHGYGTIGWDEEGVKPEEFTLVDDGIVVDYVTTRTTAPAIADWYRRQNRAVRSHGCAARTGGLQPILQLPNLTLQPGAKGGSLEDLIRGVKRGYYVESGGAVPDQQLSNIQFVAPRAYEISNGKLGPAAIDFATQFALPRFWQSVAALGGPGAVELQSIGVDQPDTDRLIAVSASVVPLLVRELNVVNLGKEA